MADSAEKYADKVDPMHKAAMDLTIGAFHQIDIVIDRLRKLDKAERDSHSIMHITDPTMYRDMIYSKSFALQMKIIRAAIDFHDEVSAAQSEALKVEP
jgi:hypothetical protein